MSVNRPGHPDKELLADLAAEVLPRDVAGRVQSHVVDCARCANLLAEAEGVRSLLRREAVPAMPDDVARRLEAALRAAAREAAATTPAISSPLVDAGTRPVVTVAAARARRLSRGPQRSRREALAERRTERSRRFGGRLAAAAAAVLFVAAAGTALRLALPINGNETTTSTEAGSAADSAGAPPLVAPVLATGTDYRKSDLGAQVKALVDESHAGLKAESAPTSSGSDRAVAPSPQSARGGATSSQGNQSLRSPDALRACLSALGLDGQQPIAVDLARYQGREAAVIVMPGDGSGYVIWAVARDCRPGADGTLDYVRVAS